MKTNSCYIVWFRQDLRVSDNPALLEASKQGSILPIYITDPSLGSASYWWLSNSLKKLSADLDNKLQIFQGNPEEIISQLVQQHNAVGVYWNRCYEPERIKQDTQIKALLSQQNIKCQSFNGSLLFEPWEILKQDKTPYSVFTPYYQNGCLKANPPRKPLPVPKKLILSQKFHCEIGEKAAQKKLRDFLENNLETYASHRDFPEYNATSRLSAHLHFGEISPHQIWWSLDSQINPFLRQLIWREFSYYLLFHFPEFPSKNYQSKFDRFPWKDNKEFLTAWQQGQTGYPLVDAGMRELLQTGTMHNRVRMIVASFLTKNLQIHWYHGASWFWDHLFDADLANNSVSWQWVAGCGVDASPFFRIFNPTTQGEKFDPEGHYTKRFVPELSKLPKQYLFKPWDAPKPPANYPKPIVNLKASREEALKAFRAL